MTGADDEFEQFFRSSYVDLVRSLSPAGDDAAEAVQEAFVEAMIRWRRIGGYDKPIAWVRRVAVNRMLNRRRSRSRRDAVVARMTTAEMTSNADPTDRLDVETAVLALPKQQRIVVALYYLSDLPVSEVADAMGISPGAVKFHLHAAREHLRGYLEVHDEP